MDNSGPLLGAWVFGLIIGSAITYYIVRTAMKDALKQTNYYLEILAKKIIDEKNEK